MYDERAIQRLIRMGGPELALEIVERFLSEAPRRLEAAAAELSQGDFSSLEHNLHRLCSDAGWLGVPGIHSLASDGEQMAMQKDPLALEALLPKLHEQCEAVYAEFQALGEKLRGTP